MDTTRTIYIIFLGLVFIWCGLIVGVPILMTLGDGYRETALFPYSVFGRFCHQIEDRSFVMMGEKFAVCIRCTSIYFGFLVSMIIYPLIRKIGFVKIPPISVLVTISSIIASDALLTLVGLWESTTLTRILTGILLGGVLPWYIVPTLIDAVDGLKRDRNIESTIKLLGD